MLDSIFLRSFVATQGIYVILLPKNTAFLKARYAATWALLLGLLALALPQHPSNYYHILDLDSSANPYQVQTQYKQLVKQWHPDKNANVPGAKTRFEQIQKAYETLISDKKRAHYSRFGDFNASDVEERKIALILCLAVATHVLYFLLAFAFTSNRHLRFARQIMAAYSMGAFALELLLRYVDDDIFVIVPWFGTLLPFEKIAFARQLYPFVLGFSSMISLSFYYDPELVNIYMLRTLLATNRVITERLKECTEALEVIRTRLRPTTATAIPQGQDRQPLTVAPSDHEALSNLVAQISPEQLHVLRKVLNVSPEKPKRFTFLRSVNWPQLGIWAAVFIAWFYWHSS